MKYYEIITSKSKIKIDEGDLKKFIANCDSGKFIKLKKAIVNPSFVSEIVPISVKRALLDEPKTNRYKGKLDREKGVFKLDKPIALVKEGLEDEFEKPE